MTDVPTGSDKEKFDTLDLLLREDLVHVHLTPIEGVVLPPHLMKSETVTLQLSRLFRGGLELTEDKIIADLLFGGRYFCCHIPFRSIWGATSNNGANVVWQESAPPSVLEKLRQPQLKSVKKGPQPAPQLQVEPPAEAPPTPEDEKPSPPSGPSKRKIPHLRRVK